MHMVYPSPVRVLVRRRAEAVRQIAAGWARRLGSALSGFGEAGPAGVAISLAVAGVIGVLALRLILLAETGASLRVQRQPALEVTRNAPVRAERLTPTGGASSSTVRAAPPLILIAGSLEQAEELRLGQEEANAVLISSSSPPMVYSIIVLVTAEDEERFRMALSESENLRAASNLQPAVIVDMRYEGGRGTACSAGGCPMR